MTYDINIRTNIKAFEKNVSAFAFKQLPFATAQAMSALAQDVAQAEADNEEKVLDRPKPFTKNAIRVGRARKERPVAVVFMQDITARYLEPYQFGGRNVLNSKALLRPVDAKGDLDQFGNLPRRFMASLRGREDIFIGTVKTKSGEISGVWQRSVQEGTTSVPVARMDRNGRMRMGKTRKRVNTSGKLKLLIRFSDAHPVKQFLDYFGVADRTVQRNFNRRMGQELAKAIATARR